MSQTYAGVSNSPPHDRYCTMPQGKPAAADAKDVVYRGIPVVVLLWLATLGIGYSIYLCYQWSRELNGLHQQVRHSPRLVLLLSIVTLGLGGIIYECIFANELERYFRDRGRYDSMPNLMIWVIALNALAVACSFTGFGVLVAIPCGMAATCLLQAEFNKLAVIQ
jgi:hypothetical protein